MVSATVWLFLTLSTVGARNCQLGRDQGYECEEPAGTRFYFDKRTGVCQPMRYKGCGGNENLFSSAEDCRSSCSSSSTSTEVQSTGNELDIASVCSLPSGINLPTNSTQRCDVTCPTGFTCSQQQKLCCPTRELVCQLPADAGHETETHRHYGRYTWDPRLQNCIRFSYFGSQGNFNNFRTYLECKDFCGRSFI